MKSLKYLCPELASRTEEELEAPMSELASDTDTERDHKRGRR